jgi:hypothetical protein
MSAPGPFSSANPFSSGFLKAWVDQAGALQEMFAGLVDQSAGAVPPSMPPPLTAPWKDFVAAMEMGGFKPEQILAGAPALGLSREYQETAARLLDLSKQFQQRYAEFAQQNAAIMQDAFHVLKKRFDAAPADRKTPADLYDAWIDSAESTYAQAAHSERFALLLAELCNISSAFKIERGKLTEQIARHLGRDARARAIGIAEHAGTGRRRGRHLRKAVRVQRR